MSTLHLTSFVDVDRPELQHSSITDLPNFDDFGPDLSSLLKDSLTVDPSNGLAYTASARLWELLLERYRVPFLLLRVADMRMTLGSKVTALSLYEELQTTLEDPEFDRWISRTRASILAEADQQLSIYKNDLSVTPGFSPSQRWRPTAANDPFPYCKLQRCQINAMRDQWRNTDASPEDAQAKFLNFHCLETNIVEGTVQFDAFEASKMIQVGFFNEADLVDVRNPVGGAVRDRANALSILQDTHKALSEILTFLEDEPPNLTLETLCSVHAKLMWTSRVLFSGTGTGRRLAYQNIGITRQVSRVNVSAKFQGVKVQFCPSDQVDAELNAFCKRFNELIQQADSDPFASAAWISHVFVTIHPFEDGNGRLSRILASIPLLKNGLPPLCVPDSFKQPYILLLNNVRANRDGDYQSLMKLLYDATMGSLGILQAMV